jgi:hypothetical protein
MDLAGVTYYAETATEIIDIGILGYAAMDHDTALITRYDDLVAYADALQGCLVAQALEKGYFDPAAVSEGILTAVMCERLIPYEPLVDGLPLEWPGGLPPLVLIRTDYAPFSDRPVPTGNVIWLDPYTELTYLKSLNSLGVIKLLVAP